jgi:hypothetical protein
LDVVECGVVRAVAGREEFIVRRDHNAWKIALWNGLS